MRHWIALIGVLVIIAACDEATTETPASVSKPTTVLASTTTSVTTTTTTEATTTTTTEAATAVAVPDMTWRRVEFEAGPGINVVEAVAPIIDCGDAGGCGPVEGYVAVGSVLVEGRRSGLVWLSRDGDAWTQIGVFRSDEEGVRYHVHDVAYRGGTIVAVGGIDPTPIPDLLIFTADERREPRVWVSRDLGDTWSEVASDTEVFTDAGEESVASAGPGMNVMTSVVAGSDGFLAGGYTGIWSSVDGFSWEKVTDEADGWRIAAVGSGWAGIGWLGSFTSADGQAWAVTEQPWVGYYDEDTQPPKAGIWEDLVDGPTGLVAVGVRWPDDPSTSGWDSFPAAWLSSDGAGWRQISIEGSIYGYEDIYSVERVGDWLLAVGDYHRRTETDSRALMWLSPDGGLTWITMSLDADIFGKLDGPSSRLFDITRIDDPDAEPGRVKVIVSGYYGDKPAIWHGVITP